MKNRPTLRRRVLSVDADARRREGQRDQQGLAAAAREGQRAFARRRGSRRRYGKCRPGMAGSRRHGIGRGARSGAVVGKPGDRSAGLRKGLLIRVRRPSSLGRGERARVSGRADGRAR